MLKWLFGGSRVSDKEVLLAAIHALHEQQKTMQAWLQMFSAASAPPPPGWTADDESTAIKEQAQERGIVLPEALKSASERERVEWLAQQMESDEGW